MHIVLLEDDRDAREAMAALLSLDAHTVLQAHDAASFDRVTKDLSSEAVIFDLHLADEASGLALAMEYQGRRKAAGLAPAKLIALSGSANHHQLFMNLKTPYPVEHRFTKPADHAEILIALNR